MARACVIAALVAWAGLSAHAQGIVSTPSANLTVTVAIFASSATDPNVDTPVSTRQYNQATCNGVTFVEESGPFTNPTIAYYPDVKDATTYECTVTITQQVTELPNGTYKLSIKRGVGSYIPLSSTFTKS